MRCYVICLLAPINFSLHLVKQLYAFTFTSGVFPSYASNLRQVRYKAKLGMGSQRRKSRYYRDLFSAKYAS